MQKYTKWNLLEILILRLTSVKQTCCLLRQESRLLPNIFSIYRILSHDIARTFYYTKRVPYLFCHEVRRSSRQTNDAQNINPMYAFHGMITCPLPIIADTISFSLHAKLSMIENIEFRPTL